MQSKTRVRPEVRSYVLITGAAGGLGKAFCAECAARGWPLFLTGRNPQTLDLLACGVERQYGVPVLYQPCDLTDADAREALWEHIQHLGIRFHMLINVAGLDCEGPFAELAVRELRMVLRLNIESTVETTRRALPYRDPTRTLRIINVASLAAFYPMPVKAIYAASKRFLLDWSLALAEELKDSDVTVTALCPAGMPTQAQTIQEIAVQGWLGRITTVNVGDVAARTISHAQRGRRVYIPGWINRVLHAAGILAPASVAAGVIGCRWQQARRRAAETAALPIEGAATPAAEQRLSLLPTEAALKQASCPPGLAGRTIVITGATAGIGRATLEALAAQGAHVIGVGRSAQRCNETRRAVQAQWPTAQVDFVVADLAAQRQVLQAASDIRALLAERNAPLDALINNAGTVSTWFAATEDGYELQFAVNHLAGFLLAHELLPLLQAAPAGRVVTVSARSHRAGRIHWDDVMLRRHYSALRAYQQSKLANVLFTAEFNRRYASRGAVRAFAADPGLVNTAIGLKGTTGLATWIWQQRRKSGRPPKVPARNIVFLATDPAADIGRGSYWQDCRPLRPSRYALDEAHAARLWALSERLCGLEESTEG